MGLRKRLPLLAAVLSAALALPAQGPGDQPAPGPEKAGDSGFAIGPDEVVFATDETKGIPLIQFIKLAEKVTGKTFIPPRGVGGPAVGGGPGEQIAFIGRKKVKKENFFEFFQVVLKIWKYGVVKRGEGDTVVWQVVNLTGQDRNEVKNAITFVPSTELQEYATSEGMVVLTTVKFKYVDPRQASQTLRSFVQDPLGINRITSMGNSDSMLISGFAPWVWTMYRMINLVDVPLELDRPKIQIVPLEHASADELEPILTDLVGKGSAYNQAAQAGKGSNRNNPNQQPIESSIIPDGRTNSLIITASDENMDVILDLVIKLDTPAQDIDGDFHVVQLVNALAKDVEKVLKEFLRESQASRQQARQQQGSRTQRRELKPVVVAEEKSNTLLITASKSRFTEILELIEEIDVRPDQVLIKAALVEVNVTDTFTFGTELGLVDLAGEGVDYTRPFGFTNFNLSSFEDTDSDNFPDIRLPNFDNPPSGLLGGIISGGDFAVPLLLNMSSTNQIGNVLSIPSVLVNSNEAATVNSTEEVATQETNQGTATTSTGFQGYQEAGITMNISPSISEENYLKLGITLEVSRFVGSSTAGLPPNKVTRKITTDVTIPSGDTLVIGGVLKDDANSGETGIPFLKDIPLLGYLFSTKSTDAQKVNLYFFVTPYILDDVNFEDLRSQSYQTKLEAQDYIGKERLQIIDHKWTGGRIPRIEDPAVTIEHLDNLGGLALPDYEPPRGGVEKGKKRPAAPVMPETGETDEKKEALPAGGPADGGGAQGGKDG